MMMSANDEFTIRVKGEAPPPLPTKGKKTKAAKNTAQQSQQQKCNLLQLRSSTSINQLHKDVYALFNIPTDHIQSYQMSFLSGFPPKEMDQTGKATVHELGIRPNETITIRFTLADGSNNNIIATNNKASSSTGRQKRASAKAASASFKDVIAAQDAIMKNEKKKKVTKRKTTSTTTGNISGFGNVAAAASKKSKQPKKVKMEGLGFRLSDGKSFAGSSPSKKNELRINSVEDIARTRARAEMQSSLHQLQKETLGQERLSAANARICVFDKVEGGSLVNGGTVLGTAKDDESSSTPDNCLGKTLYTIKYPRGMEGRGNRQEEVNIYEEELVRVVLVNLHLELLLHYTPNGTGDEDEVQRARLRPDRIAQSCPDVFWSLVFLYKETNLSVDEMLLTILPNFDWGHLNRGGRYRKMSAKAIENKRQAKSTTASDDATQNNGNPEAMAIEQSFIDDDWTLVTPIEDDIDELIECIMEGSGEGYDDDDTAKAWATILMNSVQNWRVLANSDSEDIKSILTKKDCPTTTVEIIQGWIDAAQGRALEEIMLEILDGDQDALDVLREAEADNPMDLASFGHEPTLLIQHAKFYHKVKWELSKVTKWIVWAEIALDNCEWLQEWTYDNKEHDEGDNVGREKEQRVARLARFN